MSQAVVAGVPIPCEKGKPWHKIIWPKGGAPLRVVFLSDLIHGFWMHWGGYTCPCLKPAPCRGCKDGLDLKWNGFSPVWWDDRKTLAVCSISKNAGLELLQAACRTGGLRGIKAVLRRLNGSPRGKVHSEYKGKAEEGQLLPSFDIMPSLRRLWGISERFVFRGKPLPSDPLPTGPDVEKVSAPYTVCGAEESDFPLE